MKLFAIVILFALCTCQVRPLRPDPAGMFPVPPLPREIRPATTPMWGEM